jgi:hypothetical protein
VRARWTHLLPYLLFLVHAAPLGGWINDDAGITFSYARNLAYGHGLVSQPGVEPVEGYSNFLWLMLLVPFFKMHLFHPLWVPKILGITFALAAMFVTRKALVTAVGPAGATCAIALVALQPPFVIWSVSGL